MEFIETGGNFCRRLGLPRSSGQIYCLLLVSTKPLSLDDLVAVLKISKASASTVTRQLAAWGAIRPVWVPGERRDYFEAAPDMMSLIRSVFQDFARPRISIVAQHLEGLMAGLEREAAEGTLKADEFALCRERVRKMMEFQKKLQQFIPLVEQLL